ncbi:MAG: AraC family transcriptional regulator [Bacteroidetes bacterium]|nr:MAG: AraC family transcriptional regulator [Bacteroidota bacterium]
MSNMILSSTQAPLPLAHLVESFNYFENIESVAQHYTILPDGLCDIILFFDQQKALVDIRFSGIWNREINVEGPPNYSVCVVSMYPLAAEYLLKFPIANYFNTYNSVAFFDSIFCYGSVYSFDQVVAIFTQYFLAGLKPIDNRKVELFELIRSTKGHISVEEIERKIFWSQRQIHRYFTEWLGLSPKAYLNIIRCFNTYDQVRQGELYPSLAYTDQSHFIKELKKHTGNTPKQLFAKYNSGVQYYGVRS